MGNLNSNLQQAGKVAEDAVALIPGVGQATLAVKLIADLTPLAAAGIIALIHKIHSKTPANQTKAVAKVLDTANAYVDNIDPDGEGKDV